MGVASGKPVLSEEDCAYIANQTLTMPSEVRKDLLYHVLLAIKPSSPIQVSKKCHLVILVPKISVLQKKEMGIKTKQSTVQYRSCVNWGSFSDKFLMKMEGLTVFFSFLYFYVWVISLLPSYINTFKWKKKLLPQFVPLNWTRYKYSTSYMPKWPSQLQAADLKISLLEG